METPHDKPNEFDTKFNEVTEWFQGMKAAREAYASAYNIYSEHVRFRAILDKIPEQDKALKGQIEQQLIEPLTSLRDALGPTPQLNLNTLQYSGASASSGSLYVLNELKEYKPKDPVWFGGYRQDVFAIVKEGQAEKDSSSFISQELHGLHAPLGEEFDELVEVYGRYKGHLENGTALGFKMRTVLEHFKGICSKTAVIEIHGSFKKLKDKLTWNKIAEHVSLGDRNSKYANQLIKLTSQFASLHNTLSEEAKSYTPDEETIETQYTETIQYLEAALKLVDGDKIRKALKIS